MNFSDILSNYKPYIELKKRIKNKSYPIDVSGICEAAQGHFISSLCEDENKKALVVCYTDTEAAELYKELLFYRNDVYRFPSKELMLYNADAFGRETEHRRLRSLYSWEKGGILVAGVDALMQYTVKRKHFESFRLEFSVGETYNLDEIKQKLVSMGYTNTPEVDGTGLFSVRGGIIDIFSPNLKLPVRIEFFDDEVDSIRIFDWETQRSVENVESAVIVPACEPLMTEDERERLICHLEYLSSENPDDEVVSSELDKARDGLIFPSVDKYIKEIYGEIPSLIDFLDDDTVFMVDTKRIEERLSTFVRDKAEIFSELFEKKLIYSDVSDFYSDGIKIAKKLELQSRINLNVFDSKKGGIEFNSRQTVSFHGKIEYLYEDLEKWSDESKTVVILAQTDDKARNLKGVLSEKGFKCELSGEIVENTVSILIGGIKNGFEYPDCGFVLISDREIFEGRERRIKRKIENTKRIKSYNDISIGDYVVHQVHGIGVYEGIKKMTVNGISKDYLKVSYKDNDSLYVPVEQLDILYKYSGTDGSKVKVSKLGGKEWSNTKQRVKKSTEDMAKRLVALYAERERSKGYAFSRDTVWQRDFEDSFSYSETEDQLRSIEEVKSDMESEKPMDRLLCGDVGFGKTEVALRAAFKAVMDSKQVAYLCPTTILAMQHYNTFAERMRDFPIKIEMLSRFRTKAQQDKIISKLKKGEIDIVIGTHRMIQNDVEFKDIGLLIIDEEQRFGVAHKERLKELKKNIDVLSMTATPIPRTLHMSMISVRDMSVLTQPPQNRYPIQTYVLENNPEVIIDAIRMELARGGQVYYLHNRVQGIYKTAAWIQKQFPDKVVRVGHGKMDENQLEDIMHDMVTGETDILVCTTIIETGLDIPNANTIIVEDADKMGLSQLYQLRGRVGRSNRKAYAFLTYSRDKVISEVAQKRLRAIKEFTEFGSGFKIALKDLEIRGAGDILGAQQHGHMDAVGYDLYCKILKQSVDEARGAEVAPEIETTVDISIDAYLPERYISEPSQRIDIYKKISMIESDEDRIEMEDELIDRYGDLPRTAINVIRVALLRAKAHKAGISEIVHRGGMLTFKFANVDVQILIGLVQGNGNKYKLIPGDVPVLKISLPDKADVMKEAEEAVSFFAG